MIDGKNIRIPSRGSWLLYGQWVVARWRKVTVVVLLGVAIACIMMFILQHRDLQSAQAHPVQIATVNKPAEEAEQMAFVALTKVAGRHDRISMDFFTGKQGGHQVSPSPEDQAQTPVPPTPADPPSATAADDAMDENLCLKAIMMGQCPKAYINDELVTIGDTLTAGDKSERAYKVVVINEDSVILMCGSVETVLELVTDEE